jgi:hypothetical protein
MPLLAALREADWLTAGRARAYCRILFAVSIVALAAWIALSHDGLDGSGKPLGTDFVSFWTASELALAGQAPSVYDPAAHHAAQDALFGRDISYFAFFYPPVFLLLCLPLALAPYWLALPAWLLVTGAAYWRVLGRFLAGRLDSLAILAFPAVFLNVAHGQNAFLTAALFGAGVLAMDKRPVLAGICFGALAFKPHLAIIIPFALIAAGRWRIIAAAAATALLLAGASWTVFGAETWRGFTASTALASAALEHGMVGYAKMQSVFAAVRLLHGPLWLAYAVQAMTAAAAIAAVAVLARRRSPATGAAMAAATFLASPFLLDYDMVLLAIPLAWLAGEGLRHGFRPWEKIVLLAAFVLPGIARGAATYAHLPLTPLIVGAVLALLLRRAEGR